MIVTRYTPQVGDRVRRGHWGPDHWQVVKYVGREWFMADSNNGRECTCDLGGHWFKVETPAPLPERWITLADDGDVGGSYGIQYEATTMASSLNRIAVIHVWTDANGVDHAEIERVTR